MQSRYYDPVVGRFINADGAINTITQGILGANIFAYCGNNPVNYIDSTGQGFWSIVAGVGGIVGGVVLFLMPEPTMLTKIGGWAAIVAGVGTITAGVATLIDNSESNKKDTEYRSTVPKFEPYNIPKKELPKFIPIAMELEVVEHLHLAGGQSIYLLQLN